jgi:dihydroflavonol-4-reductase
LNGWNNFGMKILVTGSTGFIGGALVRRLVGMGHTVRAFHRASSTTALLDGLLVEHAIGDLTRPETLAPAMAGIEVVFHAAAQLGRQNELDKMLAITVGGTQAVMEAAFKAGVRRVVHTSSVAALGVPDSGPARVQALPGRVRLDEAHTWNYTAKGWPYGYAKYQAEMMVQKAVAGGLDVVIVNPSLVFGAGDIYRIHSSVVVMGARRRIPVSVPGGANAVALEDVVDGHLAALERGRTGERYILGGEDLSFLDLLRMIAQVAGVSGPTRVLPLWLVRGLAAGARLSQSFIHLPIDAQTLNLAGYTFFYNLAKTQRELGLPAPRPVRQALEEAYTWFKAQGAFS